jgi:hypothetical protein
MATLHEDLQVVLCISQKIEHTFYVQYDFSISFTVFEIVRQIGCYAYMFWISMKYFWIIHVFQYSYVSPSFNMDKWEHMVHHPTK